MGSTLRSRTGPTRTSPREPRAFSLRQPYAADATRKASSVRFDTSALRNTA
jgi:hypothetical protein